MKKRLSQRKSLLHRLKERGVLGFTLIEMLVVVGVLGILTGITATNINIEKVFNSSHDSVRKSDLNVLHKAFVQYYIDNRCIPPYQLWLDATCSGEVPEPLKPYLTKFPCDPETGEKYVYEMLDTKCNQCNGGCGVCVGFRLLAQLKQVNTDPPPGAGCDKKEGCGKKASNGKQYNYGVAMQPHSCVIPTPTQFLTPTSIVPTSTLKPTSTLTPVPTATIIPSPTATPTLIPTLTPTVVPTPVVNCTGAPFTGTVWIGQQNHYPPLNPSILRYKGDGTSAGPAITDVAYSPRGMAVIQGEMWVIENLKNIYRYTFEGINTGKTITISDASSLVDIAQVGNQIWLTDSYDWTRTKIIRLNLDGTIISPHIMVQSYYGLDGIAVVGNNVWVNVSQSGILQFNFDGTSAGNMIMYPGTSKYPYWGTTTYFIDLAVVGDKVWAANSSNSFEIYRFNSDGSSYGSPIDGTYMNVPRSMAVVGNEVWITNLHQSNVSRFKCDGTYIGQINTGLNSRPWGIGVIP